MSSRPSKPPSNRSGGAAPSRPGNKPNANSQRPHNYGDDSQAEEDNDGRDEEGSERGQEDGEEDDPRDEDQPEDDMGDEDGAGDEDHGEEGEEEGDDAEGGGKGGAGKDSGAVVPRHSKYAQDPHHSKLMSHYKDVAETGFTEDHVQSLIHILSLFTATLAHKSGMTVGHHPDHDTAKTAHKGGDQGQTQAKKGKSAASAAAKKQPK